MKNFLQREQSQIINDFKTIILVFKKRIQFLYCSKNFFVALYIVTPIN